MPKEGPNAHLIKDKVNWRAPQYQFWYNTKLPLSEDFMKQHAEINEQSLPDATNEVMRCMRTLQYMFLSHPKFTLPGIGVVGIAEDPYKGIVVSSASMWWNPGLVNVCSGSPGWENAPLNVYLDNDLLHKLNKIISRVHDESRKIYSPSMFYNASDITMDGYTSEQTKEYREIKDKTKSKEFFLRNLKEQRLKKSRETKLWERIDYLESLIEPEIELEPFTDVRRPDDQV